MQKELLIFGANGALGKGITKSLTDKNFSKIYLFDFKFDEEIAGNKTEIILINDLSKEENVIKAFENIQPSKEKLFFLYSTVGGFAAGKYVWETELYEFDKMMNINIKANYFIAKHFSKLVKDSAGGSICFTAALSGLQAEEKRSSYGISKAAVAQLVKELALEGEKINLSVNALAPKIIDTNANRKFMPDADFSKWIKPEEIGNFVNDIFDNFNFISGNIITLKNRFDVTKT